MPIKDDNMCNRCFWIKEVGLFFRTWTFTSTKFPSASMCSALPEEIQALVVERVARNSFQDLYGLRASSRSMKALAERRRVYHFFDVLSIPWRLNMPSELLKTCYAERNPSTLYITGVQFFFSFNIQEEGLSLMKLAADAGYERVVYTHAMTRAIFWG
ncbi:hypothetical protein Bca52824_026632 [Brassica carinata]|uniref:At2g35280-like TPR domain-containing protein n=1 Tax=Brassica carinata TaxID=52824 RepID=A0A8X7V900_BRACI|nr:hypothetical protein Bca52824_026632 [Brassica carinata]